MKNFIFGSLVGSLLTVGLSCTYILYVQFSNGFRKGWLNEC